jgi:hypothetical protein
MPTTDHHPAITSTGLPGEWHTWCPGCSRAAGDYVERCPLTTDWPTVNYLVELVSWP